MEEQGEWISAVIAVLAVALGWGLNEVSGYFKRRQGRKQKLNRALFLLLELRFHISRVVVIEKEALGSIENFLPELGLDLTKFPNEHKRPLLLQLSKTISESFFDKDQLQKFEEQLDEAIHSLSEVQPILAYELSGQYRVQDLLNKSDNFTKKWNDLTGEDFTEMHESFKPTLRDDLLSNFDNILIRTAENISGRILKQTRMKLKNMDDINSASIGKELSKYKPLLKQQIAELGKAASR